MTKLYLNKSFHYSFTLLTMEVQEKMKSFRNNYRIHTACLYGSQIRVTLSHWYPGSDVVPDCINS